MDLEDESHRHRVAIVIDAKADEDYLWTCARARLADLVADLRQPGIRRLPVRIHVDGFLCP